MVASSWKSQSARALGLFLAWSGLLWHSQLTPARADRPADETRAVLPAEEDTAEESTLQAKMRWLANLADAVMGQEADERARSHATVLYAFRATVAAPAKCTVRIWCGGRQAALGTIIDSQGFIATKASELDGAIVCELSDGTRYAAELAAVDHGSDLALLKIAAQELPTIHWSDEEPPSVGGWVVTPGLNDLPQAIGIVSVAPHPVRGGVLGIQMTEGQHGPRITYVVPGSGAAAAGLALGDVITGVNGKPLATSDDMVATTSNMLPGEKINMSILRATEKKQITATLGSVANTLSSRRARFQDSLGGPLSKRRVLFPSALEHDSVLAPNQCGSVLVNLNGEAIGVNVARASRISSYAIPASVARPILESLLAQVEQPLTVPVATQWTRTASEQ